MASCTPTFDSRLTALACWWQIFCPDGMVRAAHPAASAQKMS
jgi:hypothetical protein